MTTIAYKDGIIAYDSRQTREGVIVSDDCLKFQEENGVAFFLAGLVCDERSLVDAYFGKQIASEVECSGYAVEGGKLYMIGHAEKTGLWRQPLDLKNPDCIGSGAPYALAAMDMGATAEEAVRAAMKRDIYTGGTVRLYKINQSQGNP